MTGSALHSLQESLTWIDELIRAAVARAQTTGRDPTDALRGLVITDDEVQQHLHAAPMTGLWEAQPLGDTLDGIPLSSENPLAHLARIFGLSLLDCHILLLCLAPELDRRYDRLYAYLQDDVSQRRPSVGLMMNLLGGTIDERFAVWQRLSEEMPLRQHHLIEAAPEPAQPNATFLAYPLKLDHHIVQFVLGEAALDSRLRHSVVLIAPGCGESAPSAALMAALDGVASGPTPLVLMNGAKGSSRRAAAAAACDERSLPLLIADLGRMKELEIPFKLAWSLALREARLRDAALLLYDWDSCLTPADLQPPPDLWQAVLDYPRIVFLCGAEPFEPLERLSVRRLLRVPFSLPSYETRSAAWSEALHAHGVAADPTHIDELASKFKLTGAQIRRAADTAADLAASRGEGITPEDLVAGAQAHSSLKLGRLAKKVVPRYRWEDLILPPDRVQVLREICARIRYAHVVNDNYGFSHRAAAAPGVTALFAGESGTGKTLAAEVIAHDLGLLLYKIDLSAVVSKYIGETEKNLSVIFDEAHQSNAVLFFDEADALFGKRSEVKDAHDRYANLEVAYLLQQLEVYEGVAVLATNLRQNLDEAFTRRLSFLVDFPFPEREYREKLWRSHFPQEAPLAADVNLYEVSDRFSLAGGNIRNAAIASAYLAAADGGAITMAHIRHAIRREHQKMGRLLESG